MVGEHPAAGQRGGQQPGRIGPRQRANRRRQKPQTEQALQRQHTEHVEKPQADEPEVSGAGQHRAERVGQRAQRAVDEGVPHREDRELHARNPAGVQKLVERKKDGPQPGEHPGCGPKAHPAQQQEQSERRRHAAEQQRGLRPLGHAEQPEAEEQRAPLPPAARCAAQPRARQRRKGAERPGKKGQSGGLGVDVGQKMGQQRIAEDTQPIAQRRRARCAAKPEHQREIPPCWPPPRPAAAGQRPQRGERERQKHRPGEIEIDVEQRRAADPGQRGPEQLGQVVVGQPHAGHPQILGREGALQGGRIADVPQEIAVERRGSGPQRVGVRRAAKDAVPKAEPGPKRCVRAFQPARGVRGRPAGQCPRTAPAAPDWPQKPGQPDRRRQPQRPEGPEPGGQALHGG